MKKIVPTKKNYNQLFDEAIELWKKRNRKRNPNKKVAESVDQTFFPKNEFFDSLSRERAEDYLLDHTAKELEELIEYAKAYNLAMSLWHQYEEEYKTLLNQYEKKRQQSQSLSRPVRNLRSSTLDRFPKIEFLSMDKDTAERYLRRRKSTGVRSVIVEVNTYKDDEVRNTIIAFIRTVNYRAEHRQQKFGIDPSICGCGSKAKSYVYDDTLCYK